MKYLVRVERQERDDGVWEIVLPDEVVTDNRSAAQLCEEMVTRRTLADDHKWRVRVWNGPACTGQATAERYSLREPGPGSGP